MEAGPSPSIRKERSWWHREAGGREVLQVALPMVVSTMSWTVMTYVDRVILANYSSTSMAAAFTAGIVWFAVFCVFMGICSYVSTFVSQYHGDDQPERIGPIVWQGNWFAALSVPVAILAIPLAWPIFATAGHSAETTEQEVVYYQILCLGGPGLAFAQALSCFYSGRGMTWVVMIVDIIATIVNLGLDWLLIYGMWGFPEMGIAGAAWASVIALWLKPVIYLALLYQRSHKSEFNSYQWRFEPTQFRRLVYYGGPGGVQMLLDVAGFTVFVILIGRLGDLEAQATSMAFSVNTISFMPVWGLGIAASILVGQRLGENRDDLAERATWTTYQIGLAYMAVLTFLYAAFPDSFLSTFMMNDQMSDADKEVLHRMAVILLYFVAAYNMFDATQIIFVSALKGSGDTRFIMFVSLIMASALAVASYVAVEYFEFGVYECWVLLVIWLIIMAVVYLLRFMTGKWRHMRVIDQVHHAQGETHDEQLARSKPATDG